MAAKKQRKRAYIPPSSEVVNRRERTSSHKTVRTTPAKSGGRGGAAAARAQQPYPVPSWKRTAKRLPIYFLLIFGLQFYLLGTGDKPLDGTDRLMFSAMQAGIVTLCFAPFMHMMDKFAYNRYLKRSGAAPAAPKPKSGRAAS